MAKKMVYMKRYRMRRVGERDSVETTIPRPVIEKAARERGLSIEEFVRLYRVAHLYNDFPDFDGAYRFVPVDEGMEEVLVPEVV